MDDRERMRFGRCLALLGAANRTEVDEAMLEAYWIALEDIAIDRLEAATKLALKEVPGFPRASELRELAFRKRYEEYVLPSKTLSREESIEALERVRRRLGADDIVKRMGIR